MCSFKHNSFTSISARAILAQMALQELTTEEINALPPMDFAGEIIVVTERSQARTIVEQLQKEKVLGFDTETRPSFQKGEFHHVALLQLATDRVAYLFRLSQTHLMEELGPLLSNPQVLKVGVATRDDVKGLLRLHDFDPAGFLDLAQELAVSGRTPGLRALAAEYLGLRITKAAKTTNWERPYLSPEQLSYAAKDAVAGFLIYKKLHG